MQQGCQLFMAAEGPPEPQVEDKRRPRWNAISIHHLTSKRHPAIHWEVVLVCLLIQVLGLDSALINCSQPDTKSLLEGLDAVLLVHKVRPVISQSTPTNVTMEFTLYGILGVDEKAQTLTTFVEQILVWDIEYVSWDPVLCDTYIIDLPREKLWIPDIVINEFMESDRSPSAPFVHLTKDGHVIDNRRMRVVSSCNLDIYTFPFDVQNCTLTFMSYTSLVWDVQLRLDKWAEGELKRSQAYLETVGEWELIEITAEENFNQVIFYIVLKRRATLYVVNLLIPSCFLITVDLFSFLLPPQSVDRSSFKMTLIMGYTVFLLIMNDLLPITGSRIPLINVFFSICLALMVGSLLETVLITNILGNSSQYSSVPRWVRVIFLQFLARLVCLYRKPTECHTIALNPTAQGENLEAKPSPEVPAEARSDEHVLGQLKRLGQDVLAIRQQVDKHLTDNQTAEDWIQMANVIDRLLFCAYILFIVVSLITITIIWKKWYSL